MLFLKLHSSISMSKSSHSIINKSNNNMCFIEWEDEIDYQPVTKIEFAAWLTVWFVNHRKLQVWLCLIFILIIWFITLISITWDHNCFSYGLLLNKILKLRNQNIILIHFFLFWKIREGGAVWSYGALWVTLHLSLKNRFESRKP